MVMIVPDIQFAKNKAAQTAAVSEAFGIDVSSCYTPCEVQNAKWELLQKMNQVKKDPALAKLLPQQFEGAKGLVYDKFGNALSGAPTPKQTAWVAKAKYEETVAKKYKEQAAQKAEQEAQKEESDKKNILDLVKSNKTYTAPSFCSYSKKYNVSQDQLLIQRIGIASNLNVTIQNRFSMQNSTLRMYCNKCRSSLELYDSFEFQKSSDGLTDFLLTFCTAHRHEEYGVVVAAPVIQQTSAELLLDGPIGGRKFRDD